MSDKRKLSNREFYAWRGASTAANEAEDTGWPCNNRSRLSLRHIKKKGINALYNTSCI